MRRYAVLIFAASLTLTACAEDPSAAVPEAKVQPSSQPPIRRAGSGTPDPQAVQVPLGTTEHRASRDRSALSAVK